MIPHLQLIWHRRLYTDLAFSKHELRRQIVRSALLLAAIMLLHSAAMALFEGLSVGDAAWLTLTTLATVGYGDLAAATPAGRIATAGLLYLGGIFILAKTAGDYFDYRADVRARKQRGEWRWNMKDHVLIINTPRENGERYFAQIIGQLRASERYRERLIQILTRQFPTGLPPRLAEMGGVGHYTGDIHDPQSLERVNAAQADTIIILAREEHAVESDSSTFDILHRIRELGVADALILAECVDDRNRERLRAAGADLVIRPMRAYPEMLVRGLVAPGAEQIIENLFHSADDEYVRYPVALEGVPWKQAVDCLLEADLGAAIGYIEAPGGRLVVNPSAQQTVSASALFIMVHAGSKPTPAEVAAALTAPTTSTSMAEPGGRER